MATTFPTTLDQLLNPAATDSIELVSHSAQHSNANDAIGALEAKLGVDNSTNPATIDYKVRDLISKIYTNEMAQDTIATALAAGTHGNITVAYDDVANSLSLTATYDDEEVMDAIAISLTAGPGITKVYNDVANTITISVDTAVIASRQYVDAAITALGNTVDDNFVPITAVGNADGIATLGPDGFVPASQLNIDEKIQDVAAKLITDGTHYNITVSYDDTAAKLNLSANYDNEEVISAIATALTAGNGITKTYNETPSNYMGDYNNGIAYGLNSVISIPVGSPYGIVGAYFIRSGNPGNPGYPPEPGGATNASWTLYSFFKTITVEVDTSVIADKTYVNTAISNLIDVAPAVLDTLNEIAAAIGDDANFATTITTALATKLNITTAASTYLALADTDERIQDVVGGMVSGNTEPTGLSVTYDDPTGKINFNITTADLPGFTEAAQDATASLFTHAGHSNVVATYDDVANKINLSVIAQLTQEQAQDYIAPLFVHNLNPNITATYDDEANKLILETIIPPSKAIMSTTAPASPADGAFWLDTDEFRTGTVKALKVWQASTSTWQYVASDLSLSTTNTWTSKNTYTNGIIIGLDAAPTNAVHGQIYYNKILNKLKVWDGLLWQDIQGSGGGGGGLTLIPTDASAPPSTFFVGLIEPPSGATALGDLWIDVDDDAGATEFIFAGPEAPANYNTDTLWIDTDEPITELIYSANEPANPSYAGELWIDLDDTAGQAIISSLTPPAPAETDLWIDLANEEGYLEYKDLFKNGAAAVQAFVNLPSATLYPGAIIYVVLEKTIYVSVDNQWKKMYPNSDSEVLSWIGF